MNFLNFTPFLTISRRNKVLIQAISIRGQRILVQGVQKTYGRKGLFPVRFSSCLAKAPALFATLFLASCVMPDFGGGENLTPSGNPITVDKARRNDSTAQIGASQHPRILATYGGEYHDRKLERMVAKIVGRLTAVSQNPNQAYQITILNSPNVNAFALPGGYVYVTRGLLALANDSAEVAAVIAHEMAHVTSNHGILRLQKEQEVELSQKVVTDVLDSNHSRTEEAALKGQMRLAQFSRNQETQADNTGITMLGLAGYDPFASPRFLQSMEAYTSFRSVSGATDASLDFLASHPSTPRRIQLAIESARKVGAPGVGSTDRDAFLEGINGIAYGDTADEGYVRDSYFVHTKLGIVFKVPDGFTIDNSSAAVIASGPGDIAVRFDVTTLPKGMNAVDYIRSGWVTGLLPESVRKTKVNGMQAARAFAANDKWQFDVVVIVSKDTVYRFLTAAPHASPRLRDVSTSTVLSFRKLSSSQIKAIKPLRIYVVTVKPGETVSALTAYMHGTGNREKLFRIINALPPGQNVFAGQRVKIIAE